MDLAGASVGFDMSAWGNSIWTYVAVALIVLAVLAVRLARRS